MAESDGQRIIRDASLNRKTHPAKEEPCAGGSGVAEGGSPPFLAKQPGADGDGGDAEQQQAEFGEGFVHFGDAAGAEERVDGAQGYCKHGEGGDAAGAGERRLRRVCAISGRLLTRGLARALAGGAGREGGKMEMQGEWFHGVVWFRLSFIISCAKCGGRIIKCLMANAIEAFFMGEWQRVMRQGMPLDGLGC